MAPMIFFFILATLLIASSLAVILQRDAVRSAMSLVAALFLIAVLFLTLEAPMVAFLQILVYAGAIMVLFLFVIMLLNPAALEGRRLLWWGVGSLTALVLAFQLVTLLPRFPAPAPPLPAGGSFGSPEMLAQSLFTDFVLPFEVASVLLLAALIGTVVLAKREVR